MIYQYFRFKLLPAELLSSNPAGTWFCFDTRVLIYNFDMSMLERLAETGRRVLWLNMYVWLVLVFYNTQLLVHRTDLTVIEQLILPECGKYNTGAAGSDSFTSPLIAFCFYSNYNTSSNLVLYKSNLYGLVYSIHNIYNSYFVEFKINVHLNIYI